MARREDSKQLEALHSATLDAVDGLRMRYKHCVLQEAWDGGKKTATVIFRYSGFQFRMTMEIEP